ncbi:mechanosensitive ion channel domain-containing protein [Puniceibacterium confluentis]|uniref:mechanosensitive ion channel domain-containing protein n=1 Tax=Puniceibacterium confluentis TaxID=1958944 RepID=UPI0011B5E32B|nr:mechanosensitive ion channel domain-containing protein [Puniceibacterium confluentis]
MLVLGLWVAATAPVLAQGLLPSTAVSDSADTGAEATAEPDPLQSLLEVLKDDTAREKLISELERQLPEAVPASSDSSAGADAGNSIEDSIVSLGGRIAVITQTIAEKIASQAISAWNSLQGTGSVFDGFQGGEFAVLLEAGQSLLLVIVLTVAVFLTLRTLTIPLFKSFGNRAQDGTFIGNALRFAGSVLIDALTVVVAWAIGYAVTLLALGEFGQIGFRQTLYLNAFLLVELVKVAMRAVLSPSSGGLRLIPISNRAARHLNRLVNVVVSILGYGQLLVVPLINQNASFAAGLAISALLSVIVLLCLITSVIMHRQAVAGWLRDRMAPPPVVADTGPEDPTDTGPDMLDETERRIQGAIGPLARHWHWFALAYLGFMFIVVMSQPTDVVTAYLAASGKIALAVLLASMITGALSKTISNGIYLPEDLSRKLPLLQPRLNRFIPRVLLLLRYFVAALVVLYIFNIIGLIGLRGWMESQIGLTLTGTAVSVFLVLLVAYAIWLAMTSWVDFRLNPDYGSIPTARERTLLTLLRNAATIAIFVLTLMFCLSEIGLNIGPLLASAGVLGLAIGFGAQKMVQDIITGVFIQFENAINVGDVITVGGTTGGVEKLTVRSVSLRDVNGVFHIIPFSSVDMVSNYTRDFSYFVCDMGVAYRENVSEVKQAMLDCFDELRSDPEQGALITADLEWFGLNAFGDSAVICRARIKTLPGSQWGVGRAYNEILKRVFDERGIEIPFPHQTIYFGEAKDGSTQPIRLAEPGSPKAGTAAAEAPETSAESSQNKVETRLATDADDGDSFDDR